jgi:uncharacterized protein
MFLAVLLALAAVGHLAVWIGCFNQLNAHNLPRRWTRLLGPLIVLTGLCLPLLLRLSNTWEQMSWRLISGGPATLAGTYVIACALLGGLVIPRWAVRRWLSAAPPPPSRRRIVSLDETVDAPLVHGWRARVWAAVPGNEIFDLEINEKEIPVPGLEAGLDGLSIAHLSDWHLSGKMSLDFYRAVVRQTNDLQADLIAVTGDIVDRTRCLGWLPDLFHDLRAPDGVYFVLGNHDKSLGDVERIRQPLCEAGLICLGGRWLETQFRGQPVLLAGNEQPWFAAPSSAMQPDGRFALRLALLHTPDQWLWACRHAMRLALAGHNHGGQICLPGIGPIICPSRYGTRYVGGIYRQPSATLHVSRGVSGLHPIRWGCRPEISRLILRAEAPPERAVQLSRRNVRTGGVV